MTHRERAAVVARLVERLRAPGRNGWCGETQIQKAVFALQEIVGVPLGYRFILYRYGPFSFDLRSDLALFREEEVLRLEPQEPPYGPRYQVGGLGGKLMQRHPGYEDRIELVAAHLGKKDIKELEPLATALYLAHRTRGLSPQERALRLHRLKPHIPLEAAQRAAQEAEAFLREAQALKGRAS